MRHGHHLFLPNSFDVESSYQKRTKWMQIQQTTDRYKNACRLNGPGSGGKHALSSGNCLVTSLKSP